VIAAALDSVDLAVHFDAAFPLLASAASTRDPGVWAVLRHGLRADRRTAAFLQGPKLPDAWAQAGLARRSPSREGSGTPPGSPMLIEWPPVLDFMFAPYGPELCARLREEADHLGNTGAAPEAAVGASLVFLFSTSVCLEGLPPLRRWAEGGGGLAADALAALGHLAHPEDKPRLLAAARNPEAGTRRAAAHALYELGDPATAAALHKLLADPDEQVRLEATAATFQLIDQAGARALIARAAKLPAQGKESDQYGKLLAAFATAAYADEGELRRGDLGAWRAAVGRYWSLRDSLYLPRQGDRRLPRPQLEEALATWERDGRIAGGPFAWVEPRHFLATARPTDIPRLLAVRASLFARASEAIVEDVRLWDRLITVLHRRRVGAPKPNQ
jgi:hypothetical protein